MKRVFCFFFLFFLFPISFSLLLLGCGGTGNGLEGVLNTSTSQPVLIMALPNSAPRGTEVSLQGVGFSPLLNANIIVVGGATTQALSHRLIPPSNGATEEIRFEIPEEAEGGTGDLLVLVGGTPSNTLSFTVESP